MDSDAINAAMGSRTDWKKLQNELKAKGAVTSGAIRSLLIEKKRQESMEESLTSSSSSLDKVDTEESNGPVRRGSIVAVQISNLVESASFMLKDALEYSTGTQQRPEDDDLIVGFDQAKRTERRRRSVGSTTIPSVKKNNTSTLSGSSCHSKGERRNSTSTTASTVSTLSTKSQQRRGSSFGMSNSNHGAQPMGMLRGRGSCTDLENLADFKSSRDPKNSSFTTSSSGFAARTSTMSRLFGTNRDSDANSQSSDLATRRCSLQRRDSTGRGLGSNSYHVRLSSNVRSRGSSLTDLESQSTHSYLRDREQQMRRGSACNDDWSAGAAPNTSRGERAQRALKMLFGRKEALSDDDDDDSCSGSVGEFGVDDDEHYTRLRD